MQDAYQFGRLTAVVKSIQVCNIGCSYCYVYDGPKQKAMSGEILDKTMRDLIAAVKKKGKLDIIWHGGEPSLLGTAFYQKAVECQKKYGEDIYIENSIQTNAYKLRPELIAFFRENGFAIGVSLDGPEFLHNSCRKTKKGFGTFNEVLANIRAIKKEGLRVGAVCVITKQNKDHIKEIYDFFHAEQIPFRINPLIKAGAAVNDLDHHYMSVDEFADVVLALFEMWWTDQDAELRVANIDNIITSLLTGRHAGCENSPNCQNNFLAIGPTGKVYPCGRFEGMEEYCYGSLTEAPLLEVLQGKLRQRLLTRNAESDAACRGCKWLKICHGGCMHNALAHGGDIMLKDELCGAYKKIYAHVEERLMSLPRLRDEAV